MTNSPRGRSSYLSVADWLDVYEQFLFDYSDKWPQFNSFVWDMKVEGGDNSAIQEQLNNFSKKSGSVFGHNEKVSLNAITPDLKSADAAEGARSEIIYWGDGGFRNIGSAAAGMSTGQRHLKWISRR